MRCLRLLSIALPLGLASCGQEPSGVNDAPSGVYGAPSRSLAIKAGRAFELLVRTIGPGEYASPPTLSTDVVRFLRVELVSPPVPAGPTQRFRFVAVTPGQAIIGFHPTVQGVAVEDTINVF